MNSCNLEKDQGHYPSLRRTNIDVISLEKQLLLSVGRRLGWKQAPQVTPISFYIVVNFSDAPDGLNERQRLIVQRNTDYYSEQQTIQAVKCSSLPILYPRSRNSFIDLEDCSLVSGPGS